MQSPKLTPSGDSVEVAAYRRLNDIVAARYPDLAFVLAALVRRRGSLRTDAA